MNSNCVFIQTGQCGNQLGYSLLDKLYSHLSGTDAAVSADHKKSGQKSTRKHLGRGDDDDGWLQQLDYGDASLEKYFRYNPISKKSIARSVSLDTEPKVVQQCLQRSIHPSSQWVIDPRSACYLHGGAGNNWALGYQMASGEFLQTSIDLVTRELEHCDCGQSLVVIHSIAGGTGSGLGTRITEACEDEFKSATRLNVAIAPYHFGEVVVQHYNTVLSLAKISASSNGVLVFENETAQMLSKQMRNIERPSLTELNETIAANICPVFLPKYQPHPYHATADWGDMRSSSSSSSSQKSLLDDVMQLCSHPAYKFLDIKVTPQTSTRSVSYTYDSWYTLLKTIQQLQLSGSASERQIASHLKYSLDHHDHYHDHHHDHHHDHYHDHYPSQQRTAVLSNVTAMMRDMPSAVLSTGSSIHSSRSSPHSPSSSSSNASSCIRSLASIITLHGPDAHDAYTQLIRQTAAATSSPSHPLDHPIHRSDGKTNHSNTSNHSNNHSSSNSSTHSTSSTNESYFRKAAELKQQEQGLRIYDLFSRSHSSLLSDCGMSPVQIYESNTPLNSYQRATSILSNSQAILPLLQRASQEGAKLYEAGAYVHQYTMYGIERQDFEVSWWW